MTTRFIKEQIRILQAELKRRRKRASMKKHQERMAKYYAENLVTMDTLRQPSPTLETLSTV